MLVACHKDVEPTEINLTALRYGCSAEESSSRVRICYDSLTSDSRCPEGAVCFWAGEAEIKVRFYENGNVHPVKMLLLAGNEQHHSIGTTVSDTVINGYKIKLTDVLPHPKASAPAPTPDQYKAIFSVSR